MKLNEFQYLKEFRDKSFHEVPFSEVDAMVLSQLSYLKMKDVVPGFTRRPPVSWAEIKAHPRFEQLFSDPVYGSMYRKLFSLIDGSRRYGQIKTGYFAEWLDEEKEVQFAAVTFFLGETSVFVSYRGTDETLVGWKEDFNMGYMNVVPSQKCALAYLKGVGRYAKGRLILGGHSKGGNLAVYAAAHAPKSVQGRIRRIYSFDGPGFTKQFYESPGYLRIEKRICKIVPEQSVIGMLFSKGQDFRVVSSYKSGVIQHDLMQWKIRDGKFVYRKDLYRSSRRRAITLDDWLNSLAREQISEFVDTLYGLLVSARVKTVYELFKKPFQVLYRIYTSFCKLEKDRRKRFMQIFRRLLHGLMG